MLGKQNDYISKSTKLMYTYKILTLNFIINTLFIIT